MNLHVQEVFSKGTPTPAFTRFPLRSYHGGNSHHILCKGCQHFPLLLPLFPARLCPHSPPITPAGHFPLLPPRDGNQKEAGAQHLRPAPERLRELVGLHLVLPASPTSCCCLLASNPLLESFPSYRNPLSIAPSPQPPASAWQLLKANHHHQPPLNLRPNSHATLHQGHWQRPDCSFVPHLCPHLSVLLGIVPYF